MPARVGTHSACPYVSRSRCSGQEQRDLRVGARSASGSPATAALPVAPAGVRGMGINRESDGSLGGELAVKAGTAEVRTRRSWSSLRSGTNAWWADPYDAGAPSGRGPDSERVSCGGTKSVSMGDMVGFQKCIVTGRHDLEPFWPSRQQNDFDRVCCRALSAPAR